MAQSNLRTVFLLLLLGCSEGVLSTASPWESIPYAPSRVLKAASRRTDLLRRDSKISRTFSADLGYAECKNTRPYLGCKLIIHSAENDHLTGSVFASSVRVDSEIPVLVLEDIEQHLSDIQCTDSSIKLSFSSESAALDARHACHHEKGAYVITSHKGCNTEGERNVYK